MSRYDFEREIDELLEKAVNELNNDDYQKLLDNINIMVAERTE